MSAADNSSNLTVSAVDVCEDELLTWLQYPVDDVFERNYCSDLFGGFPPPPPIAVAAKAHSDSNLLVGSLPDMGMGTCTGKESSIKKVGTKSLLRSSSNSEDALALGAARAAGRSLQVGYDAFNRVRTSMQPQAFSVVTDPCPSLRAFGDKNCPELPPETPVPYTSELLQVGVESAGLHMSKSFTMEKTKRAPSSSVSLASEKSRRLQGTHSKKLSLTQRSRSSHVTEDHSSERDCGKHASSCSSRALLFGNAKLKGAMTTSSSSWDVKVMMGWADQTFETPLSDSGGSQTSMSLSFREATYSGKRKHEGSELQSEDADDNKRDFKVHRKSSSRRNRDSEVHNLSERNRRNRINEKLKALQDLIPNSNKIDKVSVLDEAIEYMKTLQMQLQMVSMRSSMSMAPMMMPMAFPPMPMPMAPLHSISVGVPIGHAGMGVGFGMDTGLLFQSGSAALFQSAPAAITQYGLPFQRGNMAALHNSSSEACTNAGLHPAHHQASVQNIHESSEQGHPRLLSTPCAHQCKPQEQGQRFGYPLLNHEHEQQDGSSD